MGRRQWRLSTWTSPNTPLSTAPGECLVRTTIQLILLQPYKPFRGDLSQWGSHSECVVGPLSHYILLSLSLNNHFRTTSTLQVIKALTKSSALVQDLLGSLYVDYPIRKPIGATTACLTKDKIGQCVCTSFSKILLVLQFTPCTMLCLIHLAVGLRCSLL